MSRGEKEKEGVGTKEWHMGSEEWQVVNGEWEVGRGLMCELTVRSELKGTQTKS